MLKINATQTLSTFGLGCSVRICKELIEQNDTKFKTGERYGQTTSKLLSFQKRSPHTISALSIHYIVNVVRHCEQTVLA